HKPWIFNPQQMTVQVGIAHDSPPFGKRVYHHLLPTENPEGPLKKGDRGGFYCAFVFQKITTASLLHEHR
ncbi:MAG: hypothetical protein WBG24_12630, partial [Syntrophobacteria bacterium]